MQHKPAGPKLGVRTDPDNGAVLQLLPRHHLADLPIDEALQRGDRIVGINDAKSQKDMSRSGEDVAAVLVVGSF